MHEMVVFIHRPRCRLINLDWRISGGMVFWWDHSQSLRAWWTEYGGSRLNWECMYRGTQLQGANPDRTFSLLARTRTASDVRASALWQSTGRNRFWKIGATQWPCPPKPATPMISSRWRIFSVQAQHFNVILPIEKVLTSVPTLSKRITLICICCICVPYSSACSKVSTFPFSHTPD